MLTGMISDAFDSVQGVRDALRIFWERKGDLILFVGDVIGSGNLYAFQGLGILIKLVCNNNDGDRARLIGELARRGGEYLSGFGEI